MTIHYPVLIAAVGFFVAMFLMRMTWRTARRPRSENIRWRGIDWSGVQPPASPEDAGTPGGDGEQERQG